jgi:putative Holliday junction resolvase
MLVRPLKLIRRIKWKLLILEIAALVEEFDAVAVVMGLPYEYDGSESEMSADVRKLKERLSDVVSVPVFLQDERLTTKSAQQDLHDRGFSMKEILERVDAEAAAIILEDFLALKEHLRNFG